MKIRLAFLSMLVACALTAPVAAASETTAGGGGVDGTWRSAGYGMVVEIARDGQTGTRRFTQYDETGISCIENQRFVEVDDAGGVVTFGEGTYRELTVRRDGERLVMRVLGNAADIHFSRVTQAPGCPSKLPPPGDARRLKIFDVFWQTFAEHYPPYEGRPLDLSQRVRDRAALVADNTDETLDGLLRGMVETLGDMHTGVTHDDDSTYGVRPGTRDSDDIDEGPIKRAIQARLGKPLTNVLNGDVHYATGLPGRLGYLRITELSELGGDGSFPSDLRLFDRALDTVFKQGQRDGWRGLILDLRLNNGGYDGLGLALAARLTQQPHFAFKKRARDLRDPSGFTPFQDAVVHPSARPGFHGPVALLVSDLTVSAAETATMALLNRSPRPALIGRATQGIFADQLERVLPDGWSFDLSNEDYRTADGTSYEGRGIPIAPPFRTPVFEQDELTRRCDSAIARAFDQLTGKRPGTTPACP